MRLTPARGSALHAFAVLWAALACAAIAPARADEATDLEKRVKAAYVLKFADYVDWPAVTFPKPDSPITFGVLGDDLVAAELAQSTAERAIGSHPLALKRLKEGESIAGVNILFIAGKDGARIAQIARASATQPMLIVTEADGALERGSIVNFVLAADRVKFEIALDNADKRGLKLSSRLLAVARHVYSSPVSQ